MQSPGSPWFLIAVAACSSPGQPSKPIDAVPDTFPDTFDDGTCGADVLFTGEYVDWDSSETTFCGIFAATWQLHDHPTTTAATSPNGRFQLCVPRTGVTRVDIVPPAQASQCVTGMYAASGIAVADPVAIAAGATFSARAYTTTRRPAFFASTGLTYDATKAQLLVHVNGVLRAISIDATHDAAQAWSGAAWSPGATGTDVFLPNVTIPPGGTTAVAVAGVPSAPLAADTITYVTIAP